MHTSNISECALSNATRGPHCTPQENMNRLQQDSAFLLPDLPDIWHKIFMFMDAKDVARASCACKTFKSLSYKDVAFWTNAKEIKFGFDVQDFSALGTLDVGKSADANSEQEKFGRMCLTEEFLRVVRLDVPNMPLTPAVCHCRSFVKTALEWSKEWITDFPLELKKIYIERLSQAGCHSLDDIAVENLSGFEIWKHIFNYDHALLRDFPREIKRAYLNRLSRCGDHSLNDVDKDDISGHLLYDKLWRLNHELLFDLPFECKRLFAEHLESIGDTSLDDFNLVNVRGTELWYKIFDTNPHLLRDFPLKLRQVHAKRLEADETRENINVKNMKGLMMWDALFRLNEELLGDYSELIPEEVKCIYKQRLLASGDRSLVDVSSSDMGPATRDRGMYDELCALEEELGGDFSELKDESEQAP